MTSVKGYILKLVNNLVLLKEHAILLKMLDVEGLCISRLLEASLNIVPRYGDQYIKQC